MTFPLQGSQDPDLAVIEPEVYEGLERRSKPRISRRFPASIRGENRSGSLFEADTVLDNLSACGLYLRTSQQVAPGTELWIVIKLAVGPTTGLNVHRVAVRGLVQRSEPQPDEMIGLAVSITHHKFL